MAYIDSLDFLDEMDFLCRIAGCGLGDDDLERLQVLFRNESLATIRRMLIRAAGRRQAVQARPAINPPSDRRDPATHAQHIGARLQRVLCHPVTGIALAGLAIRFPQLRAPVATMTAFCAGTVGLDELTEAARQLPTIFGGDNAPVPQLGAPAPLLLGAGRGILRDLEEQGSTSDRQTAKKLSNARAASALAINPANRNAALTAITTREDLAPSDVVFPPLGDGWDAVLNWSRLEAMSRGTRDTALALSGTAGAAQAPLTVRDVGEIAADMMED